MPGPSPNIENLVRERAVPGTLPLKPRRHASHPPTIRVRVVRPRSGSRPGRRGSAAGPEVPGAPDPEAGLVDFMGFVVDDVQDFWRSDFGGAGRTYETTKLVLFSGQTQSGIGSI